MSSRMYVRHRRAYWPRLWPMLLSSAALNIAFAELAHPDFLTALAGGVVFGLGVPTVRIRIWRRRHPVIGVEQYVQDLRDKAAWN